MSGHLIGCVKKLKAKTYTVLDDGGTEREIHIGKSHKLAMVAFADSGDDQTHIGFPGYKGVQEWAACSRSRAAELINDLEDVGLIRKHRGARPGANAEYVVFPDGCCALHRRPAPDGRDHGERTVEQLLASLQAAGVSLTDAQRELLGATRQNGSETSDASPRDGSEIPDPSQTHDGNGSEISDASGQRVQNESEISEYSTTPTTPPSPRKRGATAAAANTCKRHDTEVPNCRGCGTTNRQIAERDRRERQERTRAAEAQRFARSGGALTSRPDTVSSTSPVGRQHIAQARAALGSTR